jgi:uncharacterized membrane protein YfcA
MTDASLLSYVLISLAALVASALTLFSGFGLGTLLMPAFALFFPVDVAIALTALVHLATNGLKLGLLGRHADRSVLLRFGLPAVIAAIGGAALLESLASAEALAHWSLGGRMMAIQPVSLVVGGLMIIFAVVELMPAFERWSVPAAYLPFGGLLSGFFGGLSGHQGAFRSAFLVRLAISKEAFIGTGVAIAIAVDLIRIPVYLGSFGAAVEGHALLLGVAVLSAGGGVFIATRLLKKVTIRVVRLTVSVLLVAIGGALCAGFL